MTSVERRALSRDRIAATALDLIDADGLAALSMRKLGAELGVEAMSLYHYVTNKDDLLDAVAARLYTEIELPTDLDEKDWEGAIRVGLRAFHDVLIRHEAALELFATRQGRSDTALAVLHWAHQRFVAVGLSMAQAHNALHFAVSFVMGHAANELGRLVEPPHPDPSTIDDPEMREFVTHISEITSEEMFDAGLDAVVAGLRHRYRLP